MIEPVVPVRPGLANLSELLALSRIWRVRVVTEMAERRRRPGRQRLLDQVRGLELRLIAIDTNICAVDSDIINPRATRLPADIYEAALALDGLIDAAPARAAGRDRRTQGWERRARRAAEVLRMRIATWHP